MRKNDEIDRKKKTSIPDSLFSQDLKLKYVGVALT